MVDCSIVIQTEFGLLFLYFVRVTFLLPALFMQQSDTLAAGAAFS